MRVTTRVEDLSGNRPAAKGSAGGPGPTVRSSRQRADYQPERCEHRGGYGEALRRCPASIAALLACFFWCVIFVFHAHPNIHFCLHHPSLDCCCRHFAVFLAVAILVPFPAIIYCIQALYRSVRSQNVEKFLAAWCLFVGLILLIAGYTTVQVCILGR